MKTNQEFRRELIRRAFNLARNVVKIVDKFPNKISARTIASQLIRAATSVGANIVEAQAASSKRDFINFLNHALKSGNETKFWLALSKEIDSRLVAEIEVLLSEIEALVRILGSSLLTLRGKRFKNLQP